MVKLRGMKWPGRIVFFLLFTFAFAWVSSFTKPSVVYAADAACLYDISPYPPLEKDTAFTFVAHPQPLEEGEVLANPPVCSGNDIPSGNTVCYQLRYCVWQSAFAGCNANVNYPIDGATYDAAANTIRYSATFTGNISVWAEKKTAGQFMRCSPSVLEETKGAATCDAGSLNVVGTKTGTSFVQGDDLTLKFDGNKTHHFHNGRYQLLVIPVSGGNDRDQGLLTANITDGDGHLRRGSSLTADINLGSSFPIGDYKVVVRGDALDQYPYCNTYVFHVGKKPNETPRPTPVPSMVPYDLCDQTVDAKQGGADFTACHVCIDKNAIWTAFGCIEATKEGIVTSLLQIGLAISGGVVVLTILAGAFMFATSSGNTKQVEEAQQMISSAIIGLLFVIFSVIILQFIGVSLLHIPGFGK
jgi:hypothetical protein